MILKRMIKDAKPDLLIRQGPRGFLLCILSFGLFACGKLGPLQQPPPLLGDKAKADYAASQNQALAAKKAKADAQKSANNPTALADQPDDALTAPQNDKSATSPTENDPKTTRDIRDPKQKLTPLSSTPVDGSPDLMGPPVSVIPRN